MTNYAIVCRYVTEIFEENPLVNTIIFGEISERELNKTNIFPIAHIMPREVTPKAGLIEISFDVAVVGVRTQPNHFQTQKIFGDNLIDNLNESCQILSNAYSRMYLEENEYGIDLLSATAMQPIILSGQTLLDGYEMSLTFQIKNEFVAC